jgi:hypothetical protein
MSWVAVAIGGSALLGYMGSRNQASAAESAAQTQLQGTQEASRIQKEMFDILNAQQKPYREAGYAGLSKIQEMLPFFTKMPTEADITAMPGYQFGLKQGLGSVSQGMNVLSPGSNVDISRQKFATDYALSQGLPAYMKQRSDIFNTLASIAGIGQKATDTSAQLGQATGSNLGQLAVGGAGALAGGQVGAANAMAGGLSNIGSSLTLASLLNRPTNAAAIGGATTSSLPSWIQYG